MYLKNKDLLAEVIACRANGMVMSDKMARMIMLLVKKYAMMPNFRGYTFREDMEAYALLMVVHTWKSFDPEKSDNAFAYYTQGIKNSFKQFLNREKTQRIVRDELLISQQVEPSNTYMNQYEEGQKYDKKPKPS